MKENYVWISQIWISNFSTTSDEETTKIKVADPKRIYNFVVDNFLIWNYLVKENYVWISKKIKIWIF
jgi:hypothetical protein